MEGLSDPDIIFPALPDGYTFLPRLSVATETIAAFHCNIVEYNMLRAFGHPARVCDVLVVVGSSLKIVRVAKRA